LQIPTTVGRTLKTYGGKQLTKIFDKFVFIVDELELSCSLTLMAVKRFIQMELPMCLSIDFAQFMTPKPAFVKKKVLKYAHAFFLQIWLVHRIRGCIQGLFLGGGGGIHKKTLQKTKKIFYVSFCQFCSCRIKIS